MRSLAVSLRDFQASWLREISSLDARSRRRTNSAESDCFQDIRDHIAEIIAEDPDIRPDARERIDVGELAAFIWDGMFVAIKRGDAACSTLLAMLELALYR